jgi:uncharacterized protein YxjI
VGADWLTDPLRKEGGTIRYLMKQHFLSWGDDFTIKDGAGNDVFQVDGKVFTWGHQASFLDMQGNELAYIKQRVFSWGPTYEIYRNGNLAATVSKELFTFFRCRFSVDVPGPDDLEAEGDFLDHEYRITRGGAEVAHVSKQWFTWTDTYGVQTADGPDDVLILATAVVIDAVCHEDGR